jgi:C-terminal processing protease CtpA/Prc
MLPWFYISLTLLWLNLPSFLTNSSFLTTFRPQSLNICPNPSNGSVFQEAFDLLQKHFVFRDRIQPSEWNSYREELSKLNDPKEAVRTLVGRLNEPYARYIEPDLMNERQMDLQGVSVGVGITLRRNFHLEEVFFGLKSMFFPSKSLVRTIHLHSTNILNTVHKKFLPQSHSHSNNLFSSQSDSRSSSIPLLQSNQFLKQFLKLSQNYLSVWIPPFISSMMDSSILPRLFQFHPYRWMLWSGSIYLSTFLIGTQLIPFLCPLEVISINTKGAQLSGIQTGDRILSINNKEYADNPFFDFEPILSSGEIGETVTLNILRKEEMKPVEKLHPDSAQKKVQFKWRENWKYLSFLPSIKNKVKGITAERNSLVTASSNDILRKDSSRSNRIKKFLSLFSSSKKTYETKTIELIKDFIDTSKIHCFSLPREHGNGLGYIQIKEFNVKSYPDFQKAFTELNTQSKQTNGIPLQALIIDLRDNPGGPVSSALDIASIFLKRGKPVLQMSTLTPSKKMMVTWGKSFLSSCNHQKEKKIVEKHHSSNFFPNEKTSLLLLTDENTASASEMLIEALCTNGRAISMGKRTVGKNFAQVNQVMRCSSCLSNLSSLSILLPSGNHNSRRWQWIGLFSARVLFS